MVRLLLAVFTASVTLSAAAYAADPQIIVVADSNPKITRAKIVDAAEKVCQSAMMHDPFDDFGTLGECVDDAVHDAQPVAYSAPSKTLAQRSN
jgi:hypothetical protein